MMNFEDAIKNILDENEAWDDEACEVVCKEAGLEDEYKNADGDSFEAVVFKALETLGYNY